MGLITPSPRFAELSDTLDSVTDVRGLEHAATAICNALGFQWYVLLVRVPGQNSDAQWAHWRLPSDWKQIYDERGYLRIDPTVEMAAHELLPFGWDAVDWRVNDEISLFRAEAQAQGLHHGLCVPVHGPSGRFGVFTVMRSTPTLPLNRDERCILMASAQFYGARLVLAAGSIEGRSTSANATLTVREWQCLDLATKGLESREIAGALGISESTVAFFTRRILAKFGVGSLRAAIARATAIGLVTPARYPSDLRDAVRALGDQPHNDIRRWQP